MRNSKISILTKRFYFFYIVKSGDHNQPMHTVMSNNHAEKHGESILNRGGHLIDNIRNNKRTWDNQHEARNQRISGQNKSTFDSNAKRKKFFKPADDST